MTINEAIIDFRQALEERDARFGVDPNFQGWFIPPQWNMEPDKYAEVAKAIRNATATDVRATQDTLNDHFGFDLTTLAETCESTGDEFLPPIPATQ